MKSILIDAGPMIALFSSRDAYHKRAVEFIKDFKGSFVSTLPVFTEVSHLLGFDVRCQLNFLEWLNRGAISIFDIHSVEISRILELSRKYSDIPMDFADGSLVVAAEKLGIDDIWTIDSDYYIYRTKGSKMLSRVKF